MPPKPFTATVVEKITYTADVFDLILRPDAASGFDFVSGQFVTVDVPTTDGKKLFRAYSIASSPTRLARDGVFTLNIKRAVTVDAAGVTHVGRGSGYLFETKVGDTLRLIGPAGVLPFDAVDPSPLILVGTGTGIAPLIAMIEYLTDVGSTRPVTLYFGVRYLDDVFYTHELAAFAQRNSHFTFHIAISRPPEAVNHSFEVGRLTEVIAADYSSSIDSSTHAYVCGGTASSHAIRDTLIELGCDPKKIHVEGYG